MHPFRPLRFCLNTAFLLAALACLGWAGSLQELQSAAKTVSSVRGDFVQEKHMKILARPFVSRGRFLFQAPDSLRWEYDQPVQSILLLHNGKTRRFVRQDGRLTEDASAGLQFMQVVVQEITRWLNGRFEDNDAFAATLEPDARIVMTPRDDTVARLVARIEIVLADQPGVIESVTIYESEDSFTRLRFQKVTLNEQLDVSAFQEIK